MRPVLMSQPLKDGIKELSVKATSIPSSLEFNEVLKQLRGALRHIPTALETRSNGTMRHRAATTKTISNAFMSVRFGLLHYCVSHRSRRQNAATGCRINVCPLL